ncbi:hypothetical protein L9F63_011934 [Diploptera punctata]|uniref:Uncharacterized protein n=1 Tax=Diploptera punctata TaxID=6984 RepID=A0AAD8AF65_DIPPU|nr:hypothetical protein L9F63_011934 [Diploptera punctata]
MAISTKRLSSIMRALKCRNNEERSKDEFTEVAIICMYNMSNWDRPNINNRDYNVGYNGNRNYNQNSNDNNSYNRNNYNNNNQDINNRNNNNNKYNHDDNENGYGFTNWRRQPPSRGYGNNDDNSEEEDHNDSQRSNQREQNNQDRNNQRRNNNRNNNNNNNKTYNNNNNNNRNKNNNNNNKRNEDNENSDSLLELTGNSGLEQVEPCLVHCIFREMHMLDEEGMPDKTLVTNVMTKKIRDSQVTDFVEESIEDCFELLDTDDKKNYCDFTKNLALCLEEKGRRNCEDWEDQNGNNRNSMNPKRPN